MPYIYHGRIVSGPKEGAYWISMYADKIAEKVGFHPFPGTLNIRVEGPIHYPEKGIFVPSWRERGKYFGSVFLFPAEMLNMKVWVVLPEVNNENDVIQVISDKRLRTYLGLRDGDEVEIEMFDAK